MKEITIGCRCTVDEKLLGLVTGINDDSIKVLMLDDTGSKCNEQLIDKNRITVI